MSHFIGKKQQLDKRTNDEYDQLYKKLGGLIDYIGSKLGPYEEEILLGDNFEMGESDVLPSSNFSENYTLTGEGIKNVRRTKVGSSEYGKFETEKIDATDMLWETKSEEKIFQEICENVQNIINRRKIKIPEEFL